jgi:hypothetical protein
VCDCTHRKWAVPILSPPPVPMNTLQGRAVFPSTCCFGMLYLALPGMLPTPLGLTSSLLPPAQPPPLFPTLSWRGCCVSNIFTLTVVCPALGPRLCWDRDLRWSCSLLLFWSPCKCSVYTE